MLDGKGERKFVRWIAATFVRKVERGFACLFHSPSSALIGLDEDDECGLRLALLCTHRRSRNNELLSHRLSNEANTLTFSNSIHPSIPPSFDDPPTTSPCNEMRLFDASDVR